MRTSPTYPLADLFSGYQQERKLKHARKMAKRKAKNEAKEAKAAREAAAKEESETTGDAAREETTTEKKEDLYWVHFLLCNGF